MAINFVTKIDMMEKKAANAETFGKPSAPMGSAGTNLPHSVFSPLATPFQSRMGSVGEILDLTTQQEPRSADAAPSILDIDEVMSNFRMRNSEFLYEELNNNNNASNYYNMGNTANNNRSVSSASSYTNLWNDVTANPAGGQKTEKIDAFGFHNKSVTTANYYLSSLNSEQLSLFKALHPSFIHNFMLEVNRARNDKRPRRTMPAECAFCKNNGENEECYSSHTLKDYRGRVLCPVLRAFRCYRCGATGDRAHTLKYCPEIKEAERSSRRRRMMSSAASLLLGHPFQGNISQSHQTMSGPNSLQTAMGLQNSMKNMQGRPPSFNEASNMFPNTSIWSTFAMQ